MVNDHGQSHQDDYVYRARSSSESDQRISRLEAVVDSLASDIGRVTQGLDSLSTALQQRSQTNWGTVFAGVTMVLLLVTGYVALPLSNLGEEVDRFRDRMAMEVERNRTDHGTVAERIRQLELDAMSKSEKIFALEREMYQTTLYRDGRPYPYHPESEHAPSQK